MKIVLTREKKDKINNHNDVCDDLNNDDDDDDDDDHDHDDDEDDDATMNRMRHEPSESAREQRIVLYKSDQSSSSLSHSSGAVSKSRWTSWAVRPNEPSGFRGHKAILNHASALVTACPQYVN